MLLVSLAARAASILLGATPHLTDVRVEGGDRPAVELESKVGGAVDPSAVRRDIARLFATGLYIDVRAELSSTERGSALWFVVSPRSRLSRITIDGNAVLSDEDITEALALEPGSIFDEPLLRAAEVALAKLYSSRGRRKAKIRHDVSIEGRSAHLEIHIDEGPVVSIQRTRFIGNAIAKHDELLDVIASRPRWIVGYDYHAGYLDEDELAIDQRRIESLYYDRGYIDVRVQQGVVREISGGLEVTFTIEEGSQYRVGKVAVSPEGGAAALRTQSGEVFNRSAVGEDMTALRTDYEKRGQKVEITPITTIDSTEHLVHITFEVTR